MEIELQKINNIVIISNDAIIGNENAGMKKVSQLELDFYQIFNCYMRRLNLRILRIFKLSE